MTKQRRYGDAWDFYVDEQTGYFLGPSGCYHKDKASAMYYGGLNLCGCGNPEDVHKFIIDATECFDRGEKGWDDTGVDAVKKIIADNMDAAAEFVAHFLDQKELTEHGGSVYGSWLTDLGKQFIEIGPMQD